MVLKLKEEEDSQTHLKTSKSKGLSRGRGTSEIDFRIFGDEGDTDVDGMRRERRLQIEEESRELCGG